METIKSKRTLHSKIKQILENNLEDKIEFPCELTFCEGMGEPVFKISIEKSQEDHFVDEKGQKWVRA